MGVHKGGKRNNAHLSPITVRNHLMKKKDPAIKDRLVDRIERQKMFDRILDLRKKGYSLSEISTELGLSQTKITKLIAKLFDRSIDRSQDTIEHQRHLQLDRYDWMLKSLSKRIDSGDIRAVDIGLKVEERRSKLLGLDAPEKKQIDISIQMDDQELLNEAKRLGLDIPEALTAMESGALIEALPPIRPEYEILEEDEFDGILHQEEEEVSRQDQDQKEEEPRPLPETDGNSSNSLGVSTDTENVIEITDDIRLQELPFA